MILTKRDLDQVEKYADRLYKAVGVDVEFTRHFIDRVNDTRNKKQITGAELTRLFRQSFKKYGRQIKSLGDNGEAVLHDMQTDINMPFVMRKDGNELDLIGKTIMRKDNFKTRNKKLSFEDAFNEAKVISEGGAFGHLNHPFDVNTFTFKDLQSLIVKILSGDLEYAEEKTDGHNLMLTVVDGQVLAARNKSHLKNKGKDALTVPAMAKKFAGRENALAYTNAMQDFKNAVTNLSDKQVQKIFDNGSNFMSVEIMMPKAAENVIKYGVTEIRLQGTIKYNDEGEAVEQINKENARILDGMLRQRQAERQKTFNILKLNKVDLPRIADFTKKKNEYSKKLNAIMKSVGAKPNMTMRDVRINYFNALINRIDKKKTMSNSTRNLWLSRWADYNKSVNLRNLKKSTPEGILSEILMIEKDFSKHNKQLTLPSEKLFLKLGAEVLALMGKFMALNPNDTIRNIQKQVDNTAKKVLSSGDTKLIDKLNYELGRLEQLGGWNAVVPSEGITFMYKGELIKLTGAFAPINQLTGLNFRL